MMVAGANSGAISPDEQAAYQMQVDGLVSTIQRFAGDAAESLQRVGMPDGGGAEAAEAMRKAASSLSSLMSGGANSLSSGNFDAGQQVLSDASTTFLTTRGELGSYQKYNVESRQESNAARHENLLDARSRIVDADFAEEVSNLVQARILHQSGIAMMRVSRQNAEAVLGLLR
jgi:flagellin